MNKKERRIEINKEIKNLQTDISFRRRIIDDLKRELNFIRGHFDKSWEEEYAKSTVPTDEGVNNGK